MAEAKRYFPAFLDLTGRLAVIVGGGSPAMKRVRQFVRYKANVVVIAPHPEPELVEAQSDGKITLEPRSYVRGDLAGAFVVACVDDDEEVQQAVHGEAEALGCLLNVNGKPELCNFLLPSIFRKAELEVAISTGGIAPPVAKALKKKLERDVGDEWAEWIELILEVKGCTGSWDEQSRGRALAGITDADVLDRLKRGRSVKVDAILEAAKASPEPGPDADAEPDADAAPEPDADADAARETDDTQESAEGSE